MKIIIESVGLELSSAVRTYIDGKFRMLEKFIKRFEGAGELTLHVEVTRTTRHHRKGGEVYEVISGIRLPKKSLRVAESAEDVRTATDLSKDILRMEMEKYKEKVTDKDKARGPAK
jgi:ribosomal subunit interface protein